MILNKIYIEDVFTFLDKLEDKSIDLAIIDPPTILKLLHGIVLKMMKSF